MAISSIYKSDFFGDAITNGIHHDRGDVGWSAYGDLGRFGTAINHMFLRTLVTERSLYFVTLAI